jgi:DNA polymerase I-like protein with 3'-5' exonuclease and polymerase domains
MAVYTATSAAQVKGWLERLPAKGVMAVDVETTGLDPRKKKLLLVQLHVQGMPTLVIDVRQYVSARRFPGLYADGLGNQLAPVLEGTAFLKLGQNLKFDWQWLAHCLGVRTRRVFDTMLTEKIVTAGLDDMEDGHNGTYNLRTIAQKYLGVELNKEVRNAFIDLPDDAPITQTMIEYAAADVALLYPIMRAQAEDLKKHALTAVAQLEFSVLPVLAAAELRGVKIDVEQWKAHVAGLTVEAAEKEAALIAQLQPYVDQWREQRGAEQLREYEAALADFTGAVSIWEMQRDAFKGEWATKNPLGGKDGLKDALSMWRVKNPRPSRPGKPKDGAGPCNPGSAQQLTGAFEAMGIQLPRTEKTGNMDTSKGTLDFHAEEHPILQEILEWRAIQKQIDSFGEGLLCLRDDADRLHTQFSQIINSGRMAASKPNVQQIPRGTANGAAFRKCFVASEGCKLVAADYSGMELRIMAELSGEPAMLSAFDTGQDLHSLTAANISGKPYDEIVAGKDGPTKDIRAAAKTLNFGLIYGMGSWSLGRKLKIPYEEAEAYRNAFFAGYPRVKGWLDATARLGHMNGYSETALGRKRFFRGLPPEPNKFKDVEAWKAWNRQKGGMTRAMCNHPIQGTGADITKTALVLVDEALAKEGIQGGIVNVVHDEIVLEVVAADAERAQQILQASMIEAGQRFLSRVKVEVDSKISDTWEH